MVGPLALLHNVLATYPGLLDAVKLALLGLILDRARRLLQGFWVAASRGFTLTVRVSDSDDCYDWLRQYLSKHCMDLRPSPPSSTSRFWGDSVLQILLEEIWPTGRVPPRDIEVSVMKKQNRWMLDEFKEDSRGKAEVHMAPSVGTRQYLNFRGYTICFTLDQTSEEFGHKKDWVRMSSIFAPHSIFSDLVAEAQREFLIQDHGKLRIFTASTDRGQNWKKTTTKPHRAWNTVILPGTLKEDILRDTREFLVEQAFYRKRGLPYRRGYLLYGTPGAGKSSLIAALAAELMLDIYIVNLSSKSLDDNTLSRLMHEVPSRAILLMEDIDCALNDRKEADPEPAGDEQKSPVSRPNKRGGGVTLSGLLNALDGVASSEGRLLFCTTNHVDQIDAALSRPGRCDIWVEFTHATQQQILEVFFHFYQPDSSHLLAGNDPSSRIANADVRGEEESTFTTLAPSPDIDNDSTWLLAPNTTKLAEKLAHLDDLPVHDLCRMAKRFADTIPGGVVSVSAIQGYLMRHKRKPEDASNGAKEWVKAGFPQGPGAKAKSETKEENREKPVKESSTDLTPEA